MCEANAYLRRAGEETLLLEGVWVMQPESDGYRLENIFGEQKVIDAELDSISLMEHRIVFRPRASAAGGGPDSAGA